MKGKHLLETEIRSIGKKAVKLLLKGLNSGLGKLAKDNIMSALDNLEKTLIDEYTKSVEGKPNAEQDIKNFIEKIGKIIQEARDNVNYIYDNYEAIDKEITERMADAGVDTLNDEQLRSYLESILETLDDDIDPLIVENIIKGIIDDKTNLDMIREIMINSLLIKKLEIRDSENMFKDVEETKKQIRQNLLDRIKGKKEVLIDESTVPSISNIVFDLRKIYKELLDISNGQLKIYEQRVKDKGIKIDNENEIKDKFEDKETQKIVDDYNKALKRNKEIKEIDDFLSKRNSIEAQQKYINRLNEEINKIIKERNNAIDEGKEVDDEEYVDRIAKIKDKMPIDVLDSLTREIYRLLDMTNKYTQELNSNYGKDLKNDASLKDSQNVKEVNYKKLDSNINNISERLQYFYGYLMRLSNYSSLSDMEKAQKELETQKRNYDNFYNQVIDLFTDKKNLVDNIVKTIKGSKGNKKKLNDILKKRLKNLEAIKTKRNISKNIC
jgi:hypothetical protein